MSHICMRPYVASWIRGLLRPFIFLSISIVKLLLGRITKKHSIFLALILVPKYTPSALLVWLNIKSD